MPRASETSDILEVTDPWELLCWIPGPLEGHPADALDDVLEELLVDDAAADFALSRLL